MEEKVEQKISSNGRIVIPKKWRAEMDLPDGSIVELEINDKTIKIKKKQHPLEECIGSFDDYEFTDEDHENAKKSLWRI
jgi:AbrB family looped-hinge helix DNA binding protein